MIWFIAMMVMQTGLFFALVFCVRKANGRVDAEDIKYSLITFIPFVGIVWSVGAGIHFYFEEDDGIFQRIADWFNGDKK